MNKSGSIIIPADMKPLPERHEIEIAEILASYYRCAVEFLRPIGSYMTKTPDVMMNNLEWEIKSPTGTSKNTVQAQFKGRKQSRNLVIDGRRTSIRDDAMIHRIQFELAKRIRIDRLLFITEQGKVIELQK